MAEHGPDCRGVLVIAGDGGDVDAIEKSECQICRELGGIDRKDHLNFCLVTCFSNFVRLLQGMRDYASGLT